MRSIRKHIDHFFFASSQNYISLAFFRIGLGIILLLQAFHLRHDFIEFVGSKGIVLSDISQVEVSAHTITTQYLTDLLYCTVSLPEIEALYLLGGIYIYALLMMVLGFGTRFHAAIAWLLHLSMIKGAHLFTYGVDYIATTLLFYCIIFPTAYAYSVDKLIFKFKTVNTRPFERILQLHLCFIYFVGGFMKAVGINWWNGEAIWKAIQRPIMVDVSVGWSADFPWLLVLIGISVIVIELGYPIFIWFRKSRKIWMWATVSMHIGIAVLLNLPFFAAVMALFNVAAFHFDLSKIKSRSSLGALVDSGNLSPKKSNTNGMMRVQIGWKK